MPDETLYLTTHETALAVVATAMKKSRLRLDTLILNSLVGGILFSTGGMLYVLIQANCPQLMQDNPGIVELLQGSLYPIGLFYVVIMGMDLFNANILYFSTALCRGGVSILDLATSWFVSWWFNLVGNILVCYVICNYSHVTRHPDYIQGSIDIIMTKADYSFVETLLKAIAGNFYAALAIYLQLMAKPLHVKFLLMFLPIFSFVSMGFTHSVADMYMLTIGLINHAPISVGKVAWKVFLPGALGNMIGGSIFGIAVWYLHLVVIERDQAELNLPQYELRDEQPDINMDSRVVRTMARNNENVEYDDKDRLENIDEVNSSEPYEEELARVNTRLSRMSRSTTRTINKVGRSPKNVFPVYGMGPPLERERSVASGRYIDDFDDNYSTYTAREELDPPATSAEYIGDQLKRAFTRQRGISDLESREPIEFNRRRSSTSARRNSIRPLYKTTANANHSFRSSMDQSFSRPVIARPAPVVARDSTAPTVEPSADNMATKLSTVEGTPVSSSQTSTNERTTTSASSMFQVQNYNPAYDQPSQNPNPVSERSRSPSPNHST